jgi:hypothetical protein
MGKQYLDDDDLSTFVIRKTMAAYEPLMSVLKIAEIMEDGSIILMNLMTGLGEHTTMEDISNDYDSLTPKTLQEYFNWVYESHRGSYDEDSSVEL